MDRQRISFGNEAPLASLGVTVAMIRRMRGLSQEDLARMAGISRSHLSAIEAPGIDRGFSVEVLCRIAAALGLKPAELLERTEVLEKLAKP